MHFGKVLKYCDLQHFLWEKESFKCDWGGSETFCVRVGVARGWSNFAACPVLCGVGKVDHIRHPGADMWMYLSTDVYHIRRCPLLRNTTSSSELFHLSHQRTLYFEGSLIKMLRHCICVGTSFMLQINQVLEIVWGKSPWWLSCRLPILPWLLIRFFLSVVKDLRIAPQMISL